MEAKYYICPKCKTDLKLLTGRLECTGGHWFKLAAESKIPVFTSQEEDLNEYTTTGAAAVHDNALNWLFASFGEDESEFRRSLVKKLNLKNGQRVLVTGAGAGNDLPHLAQAIGVTGTIFAQDISQQMLFSAADRADNEYGLNGHHIEFCTSDAMNLPYRDNFFDAVFHFGGINLFDDIPAGIAEMDRVVCEGGKVVFGDEGIAPWLENTEYGRVLVNNNQLCSYEAPIEYLPETARDVQVSWVLGNCFYVVEYKKFSVSLGLDMDVPHIGTRGGTIRTRYFGKLEGINPRLKKNIYSEAQARGLSRVEFLEFLLNKGLEK